MFINLHEAERKKEQSNLLNETGDKESDGLKFGVE